MNPTKNTENYLAKPLSREQIIDVYRDIAPNHFPDDELKPLAAVEALLDQASYLGLGLFDASEELLLGYALFLTVPGLDVALLDYYAILEQYRELGLGSIFIQKMRRHFRQYHGILIETEDPAFAANEEELQKRLRRDAFYRKNGARQTDISCTLFGVPYHIHYLETVADQRADAGEKTLPLREKLDALYRFMLSGEAYEHNVTWR